MWLAIARIVIQTKRPPQMPAMPNAGIWGGLLVWMTIRAVANHIRTNHVLNREPDGWGQAPSVPLLDT